MCSSASRLHLPSSSSLTHLTHPPTHSLARSLAHSHSLAHSLTHSHSPSLTLTHPHSPSLTHSLTHPHSPTHSLTHAFAWQAWDNVHCQGVGCTPWRPSGVPWAPLLLRGRRGTMCTAKGSDVRPGVPPVSLALRCFCRTS